MYSRVRVSGLPKGCPCHPSTTCGPDTPRPKRKRPPESWSSEVAVDDVMAGVRADICMIAEPGVSSASARRSRRAGSPRPSRTPPPSTPSGSRGARPRARGPCRSRAARPSSRRSSRSGSCRYPVAVEAVGHAVREVDDGHGLAAHVLRVQDVEVARVARVVVGEDQHPAVVLGRALAARDEERLADAVLGAEAARLGGAALEVVLLDRGPDRLRAVVQLGLTRDRVPEAVAAAEAALVDARELGDDVVERRRLDAPGPG